MAALLFVTFYFLFVAGPLALVALVAVEVMIAVRTGRWCNWYMLGLLTVVCLTFLMLTAFYDLFVEPIMPWSPMECCALFAMWATSFVGWHAMILREGQPKRKSHMGETESALRRRVADLLAKYGIGSCEEVDQ